MGVGELLNRLSFEAAVLAGKSGHFCLGTLHVKTVGEAISRSLQNYPPEMREAAAFDLLSILSYIIVQRLLKTKTAGARLSVNISSLITACAANSMTLITASGKPLHRRPVDR